MGPQTTHKNHYNLKKLNLCAGCSSKSHAKHAECAQYTEL
jgi:hypothetical protein